MHASSSPSGAFVPGPRVLREPTGTGVLDGQRVAVKDLIAVGGTPSTCGNPDWTASHAVPVDDAPCVAALRAAGARIVGKTVTDELAFSLEGENAFHGTPRNPAAPDRLPGGSSSGSAVAVANAEADLALGTDTGGSVRVPASFCGVHAMRPTHGRISLAGVLPFAESYDTVGWFARDATLLRAAGHVLLGTRHHIATRPRPLRLCLAEDALALAEPAVAQALRAWAQANGITERRQAFVRPWREVQEAYSLLQGLEIQATLGPWIRERRPTFGPAIAPRFAGAMALDRALDAPWRRWRDEMKSELVARIGPDEAWLLPAAPGVALPRNASGEQRGAFYERALALGALAGHAGLPQIVLPLLQVEGLPVGLSFIAGPGQDESLLDLALALSPTKE
ncbi:amidase [Curvibacter sp. PAE-UM]|uniref:amidase n=1 Tax=Curvibacter sp. PAE-UM TaxID=1714344 RepID=UPI000710C2FD|nr:amidase [Curvibacter sp. PAE-UM]KRI01525.1 amidase [Curvibacter sp. PAE-UM]